MNPETPDPLQNVGGRTEEAEVRSDVSSVGEGLLAQAAPVGPDLSRDCHSPIGPCRKHAASAEKVILLVGLWKGERGKNGLGMKRY